MYSVSEFAVILCNLGFKVNPPSREELNYQLYVPNLLYNIAPQMFLEARIASAYCVFKIIFMGEYIEMPRFYLWQEFDFYKYLQAALETREIANAREEVEIDLNSWLHIYKDGYNLTNYIKYFTYRDCCFCYTINQTFNEDNVLVANEVIILDHEENQDGVTVVLKFFKCYNYTEIHVFDFMQLNSIEELLDKYVKDVPEVDAYRRKQVIDDFLANN